MPVSIDVMLEEARRWVGTPYVDQAAKFQVGCDCAGLLRGIGDRIGVAVVGADDYPTESTGAELLSFVRQNCRRSPAITLDETIPGEIIAMNMRDDPGPHHLLIRTATSVIHAFGDRVREEGLFGRARFHSAWRHRELIWPRV